MADLIPTGISAVAWTVASVTVGAVSGALVDFAINALAPLSVKYGTTNGEAPPPPGALYLGFLPTVSIDGLPWSPGDFYLGLSSTIPLYARILCQLVVGVLTAGELMQLIAGASSNVAPIGDGTLMFWFFISQPLLLLTCMYTLMNVARRFFPQPLVPTPLAAPSGPPPSDAANSVAKGPKGAAQSACVAPAPPPAPVQPVFTSLDLGRFN